MDGRVGGGAEEVVAEGPEAMEAGALARQHDDLELVALDRQGLHGSLRTGPRRVRRRCGRRSVGRSTTV
ncbi:MAG: hypothetical protein KatS3mg065_0800 [Chloroflexota bacterium]|nr:MAG: hypothetical protein KatS3mg065_0800 [Chloroflexota bacterium]